MRAENQSRIKIEISYEKETKERVVPLDYQISDIIRRGIKWFQLKEFSDNLLLELKNEPLDPQKSVKDYPALLETTCVLQKADFKKVKISNNSDDLVEILAKSHETLADLPKRLIRGVKGDYIIQIDEKMVNPLRKVGDIPNIEDKVVNYVTNEVGIVSIMFLGRDTSHEDYLVDLNASFKDAGEYFCELKEYPSVKYYPFVDEKPIDEAKTLKEVPDIEDAILKFIEEKKEAEKKLKVVIVGASGTGKTCILQQFSQAGFTLSHLSTIGFDIMMKTLQIKGETAKVQLWDTSGQERFKSVAYNCFTNAQGFVIVYSINEPDSFEQAKNDYQDIQGRAPAGAKCILVGNKSDLDSERKVPTEVGANYAKEIGVPFFEISAKNNLNINEAFLTLIDDITKTV